jgi:signal transduction histidine kinase
VVAVRLPAFRTQFEALPLLRDKGIHLVLRDAVADGEPVGSALRGVSLAVPSLESAALARDEVLQRRFSVVSLLLVVGIAWSGGYFYWLHVQRDLRLAEMRSHFVSSVSHELKTPLTSIRMFAETLLMGRTTRLETRDEYLETIVNESERLTRLINNVLDFSKIEQGAKTYHRQPESLGDIIRATARVMEYPLLQAGFELHVEVDTDVPPMPVDRDAIQQAILNLLSNAMKYSAAARVIDLKLARSNAEARIEVVDRGTGIAHAEHEKVFQKFYRSTTLENEDIPGTGLGLTIVEHVAAAHGGRVDVTSARGQGSTFSIVLPLPIAEATEHRAGGALDAAHAPHSGH